MTANSIPRHFIPGQSSGAAAIASMLNIQPHESSLPDTRQTWEEINAIYEESAAAIAGTGMSINDAIKSIKPLPVLVDVRELNVLIAGFEIDLKAATDKLLAIKSQHQGKTGFVEDGADLTLCLTSFEAYVNFNTEFKALMFPTIMGIMENIGSLVEAAKAEADRQAAEAASHATIASVATPHAEIPATNTSAAV